MLNKYQSWQILTKKQTLLLVLLEADMEDGVAVAFHMDVVDLLPVNNQHNYGQFDFKYDIPQKSKKSTPTSTSTTMNQTPN